MGANAALAAQRLWHHAGMIEDVVAPHAATRVRRAAPAPDYAAFLQDKVRRAREDVRAACVRPHEAVAAEFAARRSRALGLAE